MDDPHASLELLFKTYMHSRRECEGAEACDDWRMAKILNRRLLETGKQIIKYIRRDAKWLDHL